MTPDQFAQELVEAGQVPVAVSEVRRAKALAVVVEKAKIVDPAGDEIDLEALNADLAAARPPERRRHERHRLTGSQDRATRPSGTGRGAGPVDPGWSLIGTGVAPTP